MSPSNFALHLITACFAGFASFCVSAQTSPVSTATILPVSPAAADMWRAASRLGYAPAPEAAALVSSLASRVLALQNIEAAHLASRQAPDIPSELVRINAPLNDIVRDFHTEREARKALPARAASAVTMSTAEAAPVVNVFSREMAQSAAAWRVVSCSNPALENPLLARMTEFWFNHLNVYDGKNLVRPFIGHYLINVIRANARHPAMLFYLDQAQSNIRGINENYARELMELHTLGVNGGYSQNDLHELARILTGWTVNLPAGEGFRFSERLHDKGSKTFMGQSYASNGVAEGEDAIRYLARQPATAHRIAARLATFFVADNPPAALVQRLEKTFLDTSQAGQPVYGWQTPDGYPTDAATWMAPEALTRRADFAFYLAPRMREPDYLNAFLSPATQARIVREPAKARAGLMLASPDFMRK